MFQQKKLPAGPQHSSHLAQRGHRSFEDAQAERTEDGVELLVREWKVADIACGMNTLTA